MKYRNASELLPPQLLKELQRHAPGRLIYIPLNQRREWGSGTGSKKFYLQRNTEICQKYFNKNMVIPTLCEEYCLSEEAIRTILYRKGDRDMDENKNLDYSKYYWQNELVRLRRSRPDDFKISQCRL